MAAAENAGRSAGAMSTASSVREKFSSVARPVRIEEARPSCHAGFWAMSSGRRASAGRIFSAWAPSTTTTGQAGESRAAEAACAMSGRPATGRSCFGWPMRVDAPAARRMQPKRKFGSLMDGAGTFAQRPGVATGEGGLHLGEDGEGNRFGRVTAEVEADRRVQACTLGWRGGEVVEDFFGAFFWSEQPEVGE